MQRTVAKVFGLLALALGVVGLVAGNKQLFGLMNIDMALDIGRLGLAALLLYAAYKGSETVVRTALIIFGLVYVGLALMGLLAPTVAGLLPSKLTGLDLAFHLLTGAFALFVASIVNRPASPPAT